MYEIACTYQPTPDGYIFLPEDAECDFQCDLRVTFLPLAWYAAEPDVGAGADFDAEIVLIEVADHQGGETWRTLQGAEYASAEAYLNTHHHQTMWEQAERETAEALYSPRRHRRAA